MTCIDKDLLIEICSHDPFRSWEVQRSNWSSWREEYRLLSEPEGSRLKDPECSISPDPRGGGGASQLNSNNQTRGRIQTLSAMFYMDTQWAGWAGCCLQTLRRASGFSFGAPGFTYFSNSNTILLQKYFHLETIVSYSSWHFTAQTISLFLTWLHQPGS